MSEPLKKQDRVRVVKTSSTYFGSVGTVVEMDSFIGYKVHLDGLERAIRFTDSELEKVYAPKLPMTQTRKYLEELEEDAQTLYNAAGLMPQGDTNSEIIFVANTKIKLADQLRLVLSRDGIRLDEGDDVAK